MIDVERRMTINDITDEGCIAVLEAFLKSLSNEFQSAYIAHLRDPGNKDHADRYNYFREFFESEYFANLTNLNGHEIVRRLESTISKMAA